MAGFALLEPPKLISRKIWVIEKLWNLHTVINWVDLTRYFYGVSEFLVFPHCDINVWYTLFSCFDGNQITRKKMQKICQIKKRKLCVFSQKKCHYFFLMNFCHILIERGRCIFLTRASTCFSLSSPFFSVMVTCLWAIFFF